MRPVGFSAYSQAIQPQVALQSASKTTLTQPLQFHAEHEDSEDVYFGGRRTRVVGSVAALALALGVGGSVVAATHNGSQTGTVASASPSASSPTTTNKQLTEIQISPPQKSLLNQPPALASDSRGYSYQDLRQGPNGTLYYLETVPRANYDDPELSNDLKLLAKNSPQSRAADKLMTTLSQFHGDFYGGDKNNFYLLTIRPLPSSPKAGSYDFYLAQQKPNDPLPYGWGAGGIYTEVNGKKWIIEAENIHRKQDSDPFIRYNGPRIFNGFSSSSPTLVNKIVQREQNAAYATNHSFALKGGRPFYQLMRPIPGSTTRHPHYAIWASPSDANLKLLQDPAFLTAADKLAKVYNDNYSDWTPILEFSRLGSSSELSRIIYKDQDVTINAVSDGATSARYESSGSFVAVGAQGYDWKITATSPYIRVDAWGNTAPPVVVGTVNR